MDSLEKIEVRREQVLQEMRSIRCLCRGSLTEQYLDARSSGGEPVKHGPYFVLSWREEGHTKSRRVSREEVSVVQSDLLERQRFLTLCREFEELTERMGQLERGALSPEKKLQRSRRSRWNATAS